MPNEQSNSEARKQPEIPERDRWKILIRRCLAERNLEEATRVTQCALDEFPDDPELLAMEEQVIQWKQRKIQAYLWMDEGKQLCAENNFQEGLQVLRSAVSLDEHDPTPRSALVSALLHAAVEIVEEDWHSAEVLVLEAIGMDPANPTAKSVLQSVKERVRGLPPRNSSEAPKRETATLGQPQLGTQPRLAPSARVEVVEKRPVPKPAPPSPLDLPTPADAIRNTPTVPEGQKSLAETGLRSEPEKRPPTVEPWKKPELIRRSAPESGRLVSEHLPMESTVSIPQTPQAPPKKRSRRRKLALPVWAWAVAAVVTLSIGCLLVWRATYGAGNAWVQVEIRTQPPGAEVRINGEPLRNYGLIQLLPGAYRVEAFLEGYDPAVLETTVTPHQGPIELTLFPVRPSLRLSTDLARGSVFLDNEPAGELQDGQFSIDSLEPGKHSLKIRNSKSEEAEIAFEMALGKPPVVTGPISAKNLRVILVSYHQNQGELYTNFGPIPAALDGEHLGEVPKSRALALARLRSASHQLTLGKGRQQQTVSLDVAPGGGLFVSLRADRNVGSIEIVTNEDPFDVTVNGKPGRVTKRKDRYYIYNLEAKPVSIQVSKQGFQSDPPELQVTVRKGILTKVAFNLTPIPTTGTLKLQDLMPGTWVRVDGAAGDLNLDGALEATLNEGDHSVELIRPGYKPKLLRVDVKAGQTTVIQGNEAGVDKRITGKLVLASRNPANARVLLRQTGSETPVLGKDVEVPEGNYILIASAPGFREQSLSVRIAERTPVLVDVNLSSIPQPVHMEGWDDPSAWNLDNGWYTRKGNMVALFRPSSRTGVWQFTARSKGRRLFGSSHIQWVMHYVDEQNYDLFQMDKENLSWRKVVNGKPGPETKKPHRVSIQDTYHMALQINSGGFGGKVFNGETWVVLPSFEDNQPHPADGRFGLFLPGSDEIWITDVEFNPME